MAEGDGTIYGAFLTALARGKLLVGTNSISMALMTGYTPNFITDATWGDISGDECSDPSYVNADSCDNVTTSLSAQGTFYINCDEVSWGSLDVEHPGYAVMYKATGDGARFLIAGWIISTTSTGATYNTLAIDNSVMCISRV
jgi:hypothetical protein